MSQKNILWHSVKCGILRYMTLGQYCCGFETPLGRDITYLKNFNTLTHTKTSWVKNECFYLCTVGIWNGSFTNKANLRDFIAAADLLTMKAEIEAILAIFWPDSHQSGTKPNLVAKIWPPNLVTICAWLPKLVDNISSYFRHLINTGLRTKGQ